MKVVIVSWRRRIVGFAASHTTVCPQEPFLKILTIVDHADGPC
jgi:hypothetical protein